MRGLLAVLALCACGTPAVVDAGSDGGTDAGSTHDAGIRVRMAYMHMVLMSGNCDTAIRTCSVDTVDDGGLPKWRATYNGTLGVRCAVNEPPGLVEFDCRALCGYDAGNSVNNGCCVPGGLTPHTGKEECRWTPP